MRWWMAFLARRVLNGQRAGRAGVDGEGCARYIKADAPTPRETLLLIASHLLTLASGLRWVCMCCRS